MPEADTANDKPQGGTGNPEPGTQGDPEPFDRDRAMQTITRLREFEKQAKAQAKELETLKAQLKAVDDAKLSDQEKQAKRAQELEAQVTQHAATIAALTEKAKAAGLRYELAIKGRGIVRDDALADVPALLDVTAIEYDEDDKPKNLDALLKKLVEAKPYLAAPPAQTPEQRKPVPGIGGGPKPAGNPAAVQEEQARAGLRAAVRNVF